MFGGTKGEADAAEKEKYKLNFSGTTSKAIQDFQSARRVAKLKDAVAQVESLNKHDAHHEAPPKGAGHH